MAHSVCTCPICPAASPPEERARKRSNRSAKRYRVTCRHFATRGNRCRRRDRNRKSSRRNCHCKIEQPARERKCGTGKMPVVRNGGTGGTAVVRFKQNRGSYEKDRL